MFLRHLLSLAWLACVCWSPARVLAAEPAPENLSFLKRVYTNSNGSVLPYRIYVPTPTDSSKEYPIVVFLHGAIARGNDNEEPLNWGPKLIQSSTQTSNLQCFILVPQCPKSVGWTTTPLFSKGPDALGLTIELVRDRLPKEFKIDSKRRYLTGVSMGGIALWGYLSLHPGFFAAGVPVCAAGTPGAATQASARYPIWAFHSDDDHLIPVQSARDMVQAWKAKGGVARYTEYTGLKHSSWKKAYLEPELFPWLFAQRLPDPSP